MAAISYSFMLMLISMSMPANDELSQLHCSKGMAAGILDPQSTDDATHVAAAIVARADAIVSWNFKHIVRIDKMRAYNQVNLQIGFGLLSIVSPQEVHFDEAT